jgi:SlyX protein
MRALAPSFGAGGVKSLPNGEFHRNRKQTYASEHIFDSRSKNCRTYLTNTQDDSNKVDEKIVELQSRLAFQEDLLQELNGALVRQQGEIRELQLDLGNLRRELRAMTPATGAHPEEEPPPPHY